MLTKEPPKDQEPREGSDFTMAGRLLTGFDADRYQCVTPTCDKMARVEIAVGTALHLHLCKDCLGRTKAHLQYWFNRC